MIFGLTTFPLIHVVVSLVGIIAGLVVAGGLVGGKRLDRWAVVFLITTIATSATGFGFPFVAFLPSHAEEIVSLVVLPIDRKSTRLNSSHLVISYAVFCLKKKTVYLTLSVVTLCVTICSG